MKKYKVAYATGSRADYGIVKQYLKYLDGDNEIDFSVLVTGAHLEEKFGYSVKTIKKDNYRVNCEIPLHIQNDCNASILYSMSIALNEFGKYFEVNSYDLLIILGDRYEMLAVAIAAAMQRIPILHLHGGETTYGNYDEFIRHSITKMSKYHFTSTELYRNRVIQMGEDPQRVFYLGALGAENCQNINMNKVDKIILELPCKKYWVVAFHPETLTNIDMEEQVFEVLNAINSMTMNDIKFIFVGTNADTKSDVIRLAWSEYVNSHSNTYYFENLNVDSYLWMVKNSIALIGNSSSGIIEAPSLGVFTINIGNRQWGRVHGNSVIDVKCERNSIKNAMQSIYSMQYKNKKIFNPYYLENTALKYYQTTKLLLKQETGKNKEFYDLS